MRRVSTFQEIAETGHVLIGAGDGITLDLPISPTIEYDSGWRDFTGRIVRRSEKREALCVP